MAYHQKQEESVSTIQDFNTNHTSEGVATTSQRETLPLSNSTDSNDKNTKKGTLASSTIHKHEELGKSFASRKIQVASLAIRSSHSAGQSPLFLKHDMYRLYQQPFVASSLSTPTSPPLQPSGESITASRSSLPEHLLSPSTVLDSNDQALFHKTWSVLAPKSESNQQRKKARRHVRFNEHIQFFDPPPPMDYYDQPSSSPIQMATISTAATDEKEKDNLTDDSGNSMSPPPPPLPQYSGYWSDQYTSTSDNTPSLPEPPMTVIPPKNQASKSMSSVSSASSTSSTLSSSLSSSSSLSLSLSSSSTQTNSITNTRGSLFFNQRLNVSTSSLPAYQSSSVYNATLPPSGSASSLLSSPPNQMALQRKGNKISRHAILEILENRASHAVTNNKPISNHRRPIKSNKRLSPQAPIGFHHTLDSVQHEIRQAIERAKASNPGQQQSPQTELIQAALDNVDRSAVSTQDVQGGEAATMNNNEEETTTSVDMPTEPLDTTLTVQDNNHPSSSGDDSSDSSTTIPSGDMVELIPLDDNRHDDDLTSHNRHSDETASDGMGLALANGNSDQNTTGGLLVYLPSSDEQLSNFGDTLLNEFDRITGDLTHMDIPNSDQAVGENADHVSPEAESCNNVQIEQDGDVTSDNPTGQFDKSSTPWRILGSQNDSSDLHVNDKKLDGQQSQNRTSNGRLYIKIIAAENLDFPINQGAPSIQCSVNDGNQYLGSGHYKMQHNIHFNHEFILDNMAPNGEFTLTLHVIRPGEQTTTKRWPKRSSGKHDDLTRYISQQDGALAQTRVSLKSVSYQCRTKLCTASFALVNGWYQPAKKSTSHHPLFLSKAQKEKRNGPVQEKAVGKITLELFYLPNADYKIPDLPADMDACENALNVQRFHQTVWRYGYMSQLGGDVKFWRRRYFKLIGGHLYSNTDTSQSPRTIIDLSKAIAITSDNRIIMEAKTNNTNLNRFDNDVVQALLMELESQINIGNLENQSSPYQLGNDTPQYQRTCSNNNLALDCALSSVSTLTASITQDDEDLSSYSVKNSFQLKFNNGDKIEFFCDSTFERERWLDVLKVIIGRIPTLPTWLSACMT